MNKIGLKGRFHAQIIEADGSVSFDAGEQANLITDSALDYNKFPGSSTDLCIGSGVVTEPSVTDTNLGNQVAAANITLGTLAGASAGVDGYSIRKSGVAEFSGPLNDITELGLRNSGNVLITRALIRDANGDQTSLSVGSEQTLKLTYYIYYYAPYELDSGVTSTPHGDLSWAIRINPFTKNQSGANSLSGYIGLVPYGFDSYRSAILGRPGSGSVAYDYLNRKGVLTANLPAQTLDLVKSAGDTLYSGYSYYKSDYHLILTAPYTLPKNHDFSISAEICWGRLP
jgi:hypothetical protein